MADVYLDGSDTTFVIDAAMSAASQPGWYTFTLTSSAGVYSVIVKESAARIGSWWIKTTDTAATFLAADTRDEVVAAAERALLATAATVAAISNQTETAMHGSVVILGAIANAGTANEAYTYNGTTVTYAGLDATGNRTGVTIT